MAGLVRGAAVTTRSPLGLIEEDAEFFERPDLDPVGERLHVGAQLLALGVGLRGDGRVVDRLHIGQGRGAPQRVPRRLDLQHRRVATDERGGPHHVAVSVGEAWFASVRIWQRVRSATVAMTGRRPVSHQGFEPDDCEQGGSF